jgi:hypothetical protein
MRTAGIAALLVVTFLCGIAAYFDRETQKIDTLSEKVREEDVYPPAVETNLYGGAQMIAGELADGRPWIICNSYDDYFNAADRSRKVMFLTFSDDGRIFDRTWLLLHVDRTPDGGVYKFGGPQYFTHVEVGPNIWVAYSITKEQLGITKIPTALFDAV